MESEGKRMHSQAEEARESGNFGEALKLTDQAMLAYQATGDKVGFAEVQSSRFLALRHLYENTGDRDFLILAKHSAIASVELAQASGNKEALAVPLFNLAKSHETLGELHEAVTTYQQAVDNIINNPPQTHNRSAIIADFKIHLATCEYKVGDKRALQRVQDSLSELEIADEVSKYNKDVWISGGHMRIAEILRDDEPEKAKEHLQKAKAVIDSNPDLKLRLRQWEKLAQTFS